MTTERLTLGEYVRRLRRAKGWSLSEAAEKVGVSYSYLSRVENDSAVPTAETLAKIASALDSDLPAMLELAVWLPRQILERIASRQNAGGVGRLKRAAHRSVGAGGGNDESPEMQALAQALGLTLDEAEELAPTLRALAHLAPHHRTAVSGLIDVLRTEEDASAS